MNQLKKIRHRTKRKAEEEKKETQFKWSESDQIKWKDFLFISKNLLCIGFNTALYEMSIFQNRFISLNKQNIYAAPCLTFAHTISDESKEGDICYILHNFNIITYLTKFLSWIREDRNRLSKFQKNIQIKPLCRKRQFARPCVMWPEKWNFLDDKNPGDGRDPTEQPMQFLKTHTHHMYCIMSALHLLILFYSAVIESACALP